MKAELAERARPRATTSATVADLLDRLLAIRVPIVLGYGGWEQDVIMRALQRRLDRPLGYNLYWFCHTSEDASSLPDWLTDHSHVLVVLPHLVPASKPKPLPPLIVSDMWSIVASSTWPPPPALATRLDQTNDVDAAAVLDGLIRSLKLQAPRLLEDPLGFLADNVRQELEGQEPSENSIDPYLIESVVERVTKAKQTEAASYTEAENHLEKVRNAVRASRYDEALTELQQLAVPTCNTSQILAASKIAHVLALRSGSPIDARRLALTELGKFTEEYTRTRTPPPEVCHRLIRASLGVAGDEAPEHAERALSMLDDALRRVNSAPQQPICEDLAMVHASRASFLAKMANTEEAFRAIDTAQSVCPSPSGANTKSLMLHLLHLKAIVALTGNRNDVAVAAANDLLQRRTPSPSPDMAVVLVETYAIKCAALLRSGKYAEANDAVREFLGASMAQKDAGDAERVVKALGAVGQEANEAGRAETATSVYDTIEHFVAQNGKTVVLVEGAKALLRSAASLRTQKRSQEALDLCSRAASLCGSNADAKAKDMLVWVHMQWGVCLSDLVRPKDALDHFAAAAALARQLNTSESRTSLVHALSIMVGIHAEQGRASSGLARDEALAKADTALEELSILEPDKHEYDRACVASMKGRLEVAAQRLTAELRKGGVKLDKATKDPDLQALRDSHFWQTIAAEFRGPNTQEPKPGDVGDAVRPEPKSGTPT